MSKVAENCFFDTIKWDSKVADCHCVYTVNYLPIGYLADGFSARDPHFCESHIGAKKYDSMRDPTARVAALGMADYLRQKGYGLVEVRRFKRVDFYPDDYR